VCLGRTWSLLLSVIRSYLKKKSLHSIFTVQQLGVCVVTRLKLHRISYIWVGAGWVEPYFRNPTYEWVWAGWNRISENKVFGEVAWADARKLKCCLIDCMSRYNLSVSCEIDVWVRNLHPASTKTGPTVSRQPTSTHGIASAHAGWIAHTSNQTYCSYIFIRYRSCRLGQ
jgi:hypothetical protein